ncbi:hypothetical protein GTO91_01815 [Heliobacterium undosum]|uniref:Uncharacterized protein n=1 Tax=Heliomicrobium undosum TaxID=121734 RepID=A0A845L1W3_9FIRM|nr:hypothetical protein [Heliomicrobium undosum]MZP28460.1 hypothetical protein [Heliomicrobium undosum]
MIKDNRLLKIASALTICAFVSLPVYANGTDSKVDVTGKSKAEIAQAYHDLFDLDDNQKKELKERGFSETDIANMDNDDFKKLEASWKLSKRQQELIKGIYPELSEAEYANWTNADFNAYSNAKTEKIYAPRSEQAEQLQKRGISLETARKMLKEYQSYDNILTQPDSVLKELTEQINEADKQYDEHLGYKKAIKAKHLENLKN